MKNIYYGVGALALLIVGVLIGGVLFNQPATTGLAVGSQNADTLELGGESVKVFHSSTCGCCSMYMSYLRDNGFGVDSESVANINTIKEQYNIPVNGSSCHTTIVGNYVVEGHVPVQAIKKLLDEQPAIDGITVPGMPRNSPGMGGNGDGLIVYTLNNGAVGDVFMVVDL